MNQTDIITISWILLFIMTAFMLYVFISFVYSVIINIKQGSKFRKNLHIGDETNFGEISDLDGDYVIINRNPLRIHKNMIEPKEFKANKFLYMFNKE